MAESIAITKTDTKPCNELKWDVLTGLESARDLGPSTAMVNSDVARVTEFNRGIQSGHVQEAHQESTGSPSPTLLRREKLIQDSIRKTTLANLETRTLKAFRNVFAHHKNNAHAKISDWVSYPRSIFTRKCGHEFVALLIRKPTRNDSLRHKWTTTCRVWMS